MALKDLAAWNEQKEQTPTAACGSACGASDEKSATACGSACGSSDK